MGRLSFGRMGRLPLTGWVGCLLAGWAGCLLAGSAGCLEVVSNRTGSFCDFFVRGGRFIFFYLRPVL